MYRMSSEQRKIQELVYQHTPIDTIIATYDLPNGVEVVGHAGRDTLTYRFYDNGKVVEK